MILSDRDIKVAIESGRIGIDPYVPENVQPSSVDLRVDRVFRVFENHLYSFIDPKTPQPDLTTAKAVEPDGRFILHPGRVRAGRHLRTDPASRRHRGATGGKIQPGPHRVAHPFNGRVRRSRFRWISDPGVGQRRQPSDRDISRDADRPGQLLPSVEPRRASLRVTESRVQVSRSARPHSFPDPRELPLKTSPGEGLAHVEFGKDPVAYRIVDRATFVQDLAERFRHPFH